jgi:hypothetical protein
MKKIIAAMLLASFLAVPAVGLAACSDYTLKTDCETKGCTWDTSVVPAKCMGVEELDVIATLNRVVNWVFALILVVSAMFIAFGAFTYITAGGDAEKLKSANSSIMYALVGIAVAALAKGLVALVEKVLGV